MILLVSADWQFRSLVRAQLLEDGYEVRAFPAPSLALAHLRRSPARPRLTIVDTKDLTIKPEALNRLWQSSGEAPLLFCAALLDRGLLDREGRPPGRVLIRPLRVADVVTEVRRMGIWPQVDRTGA